MKKIIACILLLTIVSLTGCKSKSFESMGKDFIKDNVAIYKGEAKGSKFCKKYSFSYENKDCVTNVDKMVEVYKGYLKSVKMSHLELTAENEEFAKSKTAYLGLELGELQAYSFKFDIKATNKISKVKYESKGITGYVVVEKFGDQFFIATYEIPDLLFSKI